MRHRKAGLKLGRKTSHLKSLFRNLVTSLFKHDRIRTTDTKAKELRRWADHLVTLAKRGDLHARRQALSIVPEKAVVHALFEKAGDRFGKISGGYTRLVKLGPRPGDAAPMTLIELVGAEEKSKKKAKKAKKKTTAKAAPGKKKKADAPAGKGDAPSAESPEPSAAGEAKPKRASRKKAAPAAAPTEEAASPPKKTRVPNKETEQ
jgi:large subunit ribosomal protein L17